MLQACSLTTVVLKLKCGDVINDDPSTSNPET